MIIGETYRKIREGKGISISSLAGAEISKSQISRFELGETEISFFKLLYLLEKIGVTLEEFLLSCNNYQPSDFNTLIRLVQQAAYNQEIKSLLNMVSKEMELFRNKAKNYSQMSAMIRDAVTQFDDIKTKGWITALNDLSILISNFSTELSKQGGNLNQITKRANELIFMGELDKTYYEEVISPQIKLLQELVYDVKKQQTEIFKRLLKS